MSQPTVQSLPSGRLLGWYGDDFTGAAAVMEVLALAGLPAVLFLDIPSASLLAAFPDARAIGIAGTARSHTPAWMRDHLPPVFEFLAKLGAPLLHYKVCSTLDSSPDIGSIGAAIELADAQLTPDWMPVMLAAPAIGRYQAFGHLFAAAADGAVHRLDRHPVMASHPVTPMDESDIGRHLARQTNLAHGVVNLVQLRSVDAAESALQEERERSARIIAIDTVDDATLEAAGALVWSHRNDRLLAVGSQGVEYALVRHWQSQSWLPAAIEMPGLKAFDRIVVVSGSVSSVTAAQIEYARQQGFGSVPFDASAALLGAGSCDGAVGDAADTALTLLERGISPVVHSALGLEDPRVQQFRAASARAGLDADEANTRLSVALGGVLKAILERSDCQRAVVCGGDSSGHALSGLGIPAMTVAAPLVPGAALYRAHAPGEPFDGLELALKGGQMGTQDFLVRVRQGAGPRPASA